MPSGRMLLSPTPQIGSSWLSMWGNRGFLGSFWGGVGAGGGNWYAFIHHKLQRVLFDVAKFAFPLASALDDDFAGYLTCLPNQCPDVTVLDAEGPGRHVIFYVAMANGGGSLWGSYDGPGGGSEESGGEQGGYLWEGAPTSADTFWRGDVQWAWACGGRVPIDDTTGGRRYREEDVAEQEEMDEGKGMGEDEEGEVPLGCSMRWREGVLARGGWGRWVELRERFWGGTRNGGLRFGGESERCDQGEPVGSLLEAPTQGPGILCAQGEGASGGAGLGNQAASTQNLSVDDILAEMDEALSPSLERVVCTQERERDLGGVAEVMERLAILGHGGMDEGRRGLLGGGAAFDHRQTGG
ncbi:hypothetical protein CYMTET_53456 [Cymbomonas tetramitiformis]|uniref:Uncharacterized protein n=1 Tax=Cymbomonas tetramitiformis TaxID=36881 RepID=A0AAE0BH66_9CHLO|nr:hypothetical protein CYMTET_53456 [Cymbomonas tetramitiformis]